MDRIANININCDLGEGTGNDAELMPFLTSCNIACGGHFGDDVTMRETIQLAVKYNVKVGAHPSFPDKENFGRVEMDIEPEVLKASLRQQVADFKAVCDEMGVEMHHIKLHGALYNLAAKNEEVAKNVLDAFEIFGPIKFYVGGNLQIYLQDSEHYQFCKEAFIDRTYQDDLSLVNRNNPFASIESIEIAFSQLDMMIGSGEVETVSGKRIPIQAETYCIHGDNPKALEILQFIHQKFTENG